MNVASAADLQVKSLSPMSRVQNSLYTQLTKCELERQRECGANGNSSSDDNIVALNILNVKNKIIFKWQIAR